MCRTVHLYGCRKDVNDILKYNFNERISNFRIRRRSQSMTTLDLVSVFCRLCGISFSTLSGNSGHGWEDLNLLYKFMSDFRLQKLSLTVTLVCVLSISYINAEEAPFRTGKVKLTSKIAKDSFPSEISQVMAGVGIDFPVIVQQALSGSESAVKLLFWSSSNVGLDGAAADSFGYYLLEVAEKIGDAKLSEILSSIKDPETLETIRFFLLDESGFFLAEKGAKEKAITKVTKLLPKTWKHLNSTRGQGSAHQSTTRSESKSK